MSAHLGLFYYWPWIKERCRCCVCRVSLSRGTQTVWCVRKVSSSASDLPIIFSSQLFNRSHASWAPHATLHHHPPTLQNPDFVQFFRSALCVSWRQGGRRLPVSCKRWGVDAISRSVDVITRFPLPLRNEKCDLRPISIRAPHNSSSTHKPWRVLKIYLLGKRSAWWGGGA